MMKASPPVLPIMETSSAVTDGQRHTSFSARRASHRRGFLLVLLCQLSVVLGGLIPPTAFCLPVSLLSSRNNRPSSSSSSSSSRTSIFFPLPGYMAKPGQSEEQAKQERENEIRSKIAQLKSAGKFKKTNPEESMMLEAEEFFNKESPIKKYERQKKEREQREQEKQEQGEDIQDDDSASSANTTTN